LIKLERAYATISKDTLIHNYQAFETLVGQDTLVMSVVKADAYGHGSIEVSKALEQAGCTYFGVACLEEAIELRNAGIKANILIFGRTDLANIKYIHEYNLIQTIISYEYALEIDECGIDIDAHINIDTGMSRLGIYTHEESDIENTILEFRKIAKLDHINIEGIYTHFADADNVDDTFTKKQFKIFNTIVQTLKKDHVCHGICHCANTSATLRFPEMKLSMVRIGIGLYGYPQVKTNIELLPVMSLYAEVEDIHHLKPNDSVSYVRRYYVTENKTIATIAIGYADGYLRGSTNNDYFIYNGHKLEEVGTICMDACMVDATGTNIKIGDYVEVFGENKTVSVIAKHLNTIEYEVLCGIGKRIHRIYK
jgi:alanine racemase